MPAGSNRGSTARREVIGNKRVSGLLCKRVDFSMYIKRIEAIIPDISFTDYKLPKNFYSRCYNNVAFIILLSFNLLGFLLSALFAGVLHDPGSF